MDQQQQMVQALVGQAQGPDGPVVQPPQPQTIDPLRGIPYFDASLNPMYRLPEVNAGLSTPALGGDVSLRGKYHPDTYHPTFGLQLGYRRAF